MKNRLSGQRLLLLLIPCIYLIVLGYVQRDQGPFKFSVTQVKFENIPKTKNIGPGMKGLRVFVYISYQGGKPDWWGEDLREERDYIVFFDKNNSLYSFGLYGDVSLRYNSESEQYEFVHAECEVPDNSKFAKQATFKTKSTFFSTVAPFKNVGSIEISKPVFIDK